MTTEYEVSVPASIEAEQALLGSIIIEPDKFTITSGTISPKDFFLDKHRHIWQAFSRLVERSEAIDHVTLQNELRDMGQLDGIGGAKYLKKLADDTPTEENAEVYAQMVWRASIRRKLLSASKDINKVALDESMPIEKVIQATEKSVFSIADTNAKKDFISLQEALSQYFDKIESLIDNDKGLIGIPTGFNPLDKLLGGFQKSDMVVFAGRPGMGKTSWLLTVAAGCASLGQRIAVFTMEMGAEQIVQRLIAMETGITIQRLRRAEINRDEFSKLIGGIGQLAQLPIFIDDTPSITPMDMIAKCKRLQHEQGLDMVLVDYMQLMSAGNVYRNNRVQETSFISRSLKDLARELDVVLLSAAQLSRAVEQRTNKRPILSDLRDSGTIEQDADAVMFLYRDEVYNPDTTELPNVADIILAKHRHGPIGTVQLFFDKNITKFKDVVIHKVNLNEL